MSLSREVAEAYIQVHGDLSPFRRDLEKARDDIKKAAQADADTFADEFDKRLRKQTEGQWQKILDANFSNGMVDWDRAINAFDSKNLDDARDKLHQFAVEMMNLNKLDGPQFLDLTRQINDVVDARKKVAQQTAEEQDREAALADFRKQWHQKYLADLHEAIRENDAWNIRRRNTMAEAIRDNEAYNRSWNGMVKNIRRSGLDRDFRLIGEAWTNNDFSTLFRNAGNDVDKLRARVTHVIGAMKDMGRITAYNIADITSSLDNWITNQDTVTEHIRETTRESGRLHGRLGKVTAVFGAMFRASKGFREHLGGFAGINVFGDMLKEGLDFIHNLDRIAVNAAKVTTVMSTLASVGGSGLASLVTIVGDLGATLGGLAVVLPGFLIGGIIQAAVLKSAFQDMGTVLKDLAPAFHKLQDSISAKFWAKAEQPIRDMVTTLLPTLRTNLNNTATSLGGLTASFADALGNIDKGQIGKMFDRMNAGIDIAKGAMAPLVNAFTTLGLAASAYFERFGSWIVKLSTDFNNFIQAAAADGRLMGWIDTMIQGFKDLGRSMDGIFGIFNAIDSAATAAGFGGLASFADNMQGIAKAMQTAGAQTALTQLLTGMLTLTSRLGGALKGLGGPIQSIMPTIQAALSAIGTAVATVIGYIGQVMENPIVQRGIIDFTTGIALAVDKLAPAIAPFAASLGNAATLLGMILQNVAAIVNAFMVNLAPVLDQMSIQMQQLVKPLADSVLTFISAVTPIAQAINDNLIGPLVSGIRDQVLPGFNSMVTTLSPVAAQMVAALGPVLQAILPLIPPIMQLATTIGTILMGAVTALAPLFTVLIGAIQPVIDAVNNLVQMIAPYLVPAIQQIATAVSPVIAVLGQVVGFILSVLVPILGVLLIGVINNVVGVFQGLSNFIMGFVNIIVGVFTGFWTFFSKLFSGDIPGALNALLGIFGSIWNGIMQMLSGALQFLWNAVQLLFIGKLVGGIRSALTAVSGFFKSIWTGIVSFLKGAMGNINGTVTSGFNAVRSFIGTVWNWITSTISGAVNGIIGIVRGWLSNAQAIISGGWNAAVNLVRGAWSSMVSAVVGGVNNVLAWVRGIPGWIGGALSGLGNLLVNAGSAIINGLLNGLKAAWGGVTSFVGGIAQWIADHKGPIPYDRKLLVPAGQAIMFGLESSLKDKFGNVMDFVSQMADMMAGGFDKSKMYLAGADASQGLADGLLANKSKIRGAYSSLGELAVADPSLGTLRTSRTVAADPAAAKPTVVFGEGAVQVATRASDPRLVAGAVTDAIDEAFSTVTM